MHGKDYFHDKKPIKEAKEGLAESTVSNKVAKRHTKV